MGVGVFIAIGNFSRLCFNCHCYVTYNFGR